MRYIDEFRDPAAVRGLVERIGRAGGSHTFMEVCGTHTMAISRAGLRSLLAPSVELVSGPGCPVCVTSDRDIDRAIAVSRMPDVVLATFGDMMRVPGTSGSLESASAEGARVSVVYSPLDALAMAAEDGDSRVVFLGVGFETTAPAVAATILQARERGVDNFFVLPMHKLVPPALEALVGMEGFSVDGFILPGHVSVVIGSDAYGFLPRDHSIPCVVAGFEAADILQAIFRLMMMKHEGPVVENEYSRAVKPGGNPRALEVMWRVFSTCDAEWRGLGRIPASGLALVDELSGMDAGLWEVELPEPGDDSGCRCGEVLCGQAKPTDCPLFAVDCTPERPTGPCMVSGEGTCAAYYHYAAEAERA